MSEKWSRVLAVIVPAEEINGLTAFRDPEHFQIIEATADGIDVGSEDPRNFFGSRTFLAAATWNEGLLAHLKRARKQIKEQGLYPPDIFLIEDTKDFLSLQNLVIFSLAQFLYKHDAIVERHDQSDAWVEAPERGAGGKIAESVIPVEVPETEAQVRVLGSESQVEFLQRALDDLACFISKLGIERIERVFTSVPSGALGGDLAAPRIVQTLPVSGTRLCGFELHFSRSLGLCKPMNLRLLEQGKADPVAHWSVSELRNGWNRFAMPRALDQTSETLKLEIDPLPGLSLGAEAAEDLYRVSSDGIPVADRMLALQLYAALPGAERDFGGEPAVNRS